MRRSLFTRLARDERGISAVEFAMIAPVMIFFYFGLAEFCQGYMAQKRMGHASAMVADLVAQEESVSTASIDDIFDIGGLIMKPFPVAALQQRVSSVVLKDGVARVVWSRGDGMDPRGVDSVVTLPDDLITEGESVILSEATYDYDSPADYLMPTITRFSHSYYLRPRTSDQTLCPDC
jgi:Flp pilus assembly protein TadG